VRRVTCVQEKPRTFFDEMREIFDVVVGPEEYRKEGIPFPRSPFVSLTVEHENGARESIRILRKAYGTSVGAKLPAACILCADSEHDMLEQKLLSGDWFRWDDLLVFYRHLLLPWIERAPLEGHSTEMVKYMGTLFASLAPLPRKRRKYGEVPTSRIQVLLWAHHLGYPIDDMIEQIWVVDDRGTHQNGLEFFQGAVRLVPSTLATSTPIGVCVPL
jgi:hypothetical protein